jgi:L-threonylcarbamoyladenylate synthase
VTGWPRIVPDDADGRSAAIEALHRDGIVALPTDTVYGIGCRLDAPRGIERLFEAKSRPPERAIMVLIADAGQADEIAVMPPTAAALASAFWPGGLSLVVPQRTDVPFPAILTAGTQTIGLRMPDHACPRALAEAVGPLPTTSANRSGEPEASTATEIAELLGNGIDLIVDGGPAHGGPPSTVIDCTSVRPRVLRAGAINPDRIAEVLRAADLGDLDPTDVGR